MLHHTGLSPEEVWYCGDNVKNDVEGASQAGIFPVWYDNDTDKNYRDRSGEMAPTIEHLHIKEWDELISVLQKFSVKI